MNRAYQHWRLKIDDKQILWLNFDRANSHVNTINLEVLNELEDIFDHLPASICGLIIRSGKKLGIMGADIHEFGAYTTTEEVMHMVKTGQNVYQKLAKLSIPTVMLIEGYCLGGACELALACRYRIALQDPKTKIGLPESKLGILPAWGGTTSLPMHIGVLPAMDIMLKGKIIPAQVAKKLGMVDLCVPLRQLERAAQAYVLQPPPHHQLSLWQRFLSTRIMRPWIGQFIVCNLKKFHLIEAQYPAPFAIVKHWMSGSNEMERGYAQELKLMSKLFETQSTKNLIHLFFLRETLKNQASEAHFSFKHVHVIGSGTMGMGIATLCAAKGLRVSIQDQNKTQLGRALQHAYQYLKTQFKEKACLQNVMDKFILDETGEYIKQADIIIEAVYENLELKQKIFQELIQRARPDALLATNTSSIMIEKISAGLANPERIIGIHFFNPVEKMPLVEIIASEITDKQSRTQAMVFLLIV
jgi:3-hydroxyacyl-CoA dehydrogenase/enoyl-CoA hydratase/3-hydroxybutyryl-CoA epimerase